LGRKRSPLYKDTVPTREQLVSSLFIHRRYLALHPSLIIEVPQFLPRQTAGLQPIAIEQHRKPHPRLGAAGIGSLYRVALNTKSLIKSRRIFRAG